jgi:hypothetical protein
MKKLLHTLLAVSIIFSACEEEDELPSNSNNNSTSIVGLWELVYYEYDAEIQNLDDTPPVQYEFLSSGMYERTFGVLWDYNCEDICQYASTSTDIILFGEDFGADGMTMTYELSNSNNTLEILDSTEETDQEFTIIFSRIY